VRRESIAQPNTDPKETNDSVDPKSFSYHVLLPTRFTELMRE